MSSSGRRLALAAAESAALESDLERFERAWQAAAPPDIESFLSDVSNSAQNTDAAVRYRLLLEIVAIDLERRWRSARAGFSPTAGTADGGPEFPSRPRLEDYARKYPQLGALAELPIDLITHEYRVRALWGDEPRVSEYLERFASLADELRSELARVDSEIARATSRTMVPACEGDKYPAKPAPATDTSRRQATLSSEEPMPERIGRFEILGILGTGGFGIVYRARDPKLNREVALKIPLPDCVASLGGSEAFLAEAQNIASLDHPSILPVYEVGCSDEGLCYVVSKLVAGGNMTKLIRAGRPSYEHSARLVARCAEALHHAHQRGLVHRDIKPANILMDAQGNPLLADFGLALRDDDVGSGPKSMGTLAYMSPEQARGDAHLADARSDVFSLGLVLFELLSGRSPYRGKSRQQLVEEIIACDPRPVRQIEGTVPEELDRICQKARATRPADRYSTAQDFAHDLREFLARRPKRPVARWALPAVALVVVLAVAIAAFFMFGRSPVVAELETPAGPPVLLTAPYLDMDHLVEEGGVGRYVSVTKADVPLPEGDQVALDIRLPQGQEAFLYLLQFDEGRAPTLLWPTNLAGQQRVKHLRYPDESQAITLQGEPRRIMFLAAVSSTPLGKTELAEIDRLAFSFDFDVTADRPLNELVFPPDAQRPALRSGGQRHLVQVDPVRLSKSPQRELQKRFSAFSSILFYYRTTELK
jgi:hypothetical protein